MKSYIITCGSIQNRVITAETVGDAIDSALTDELKSPNYALGTMLQVDSSDFDEPLIGLTYTLLKRVTSDADAIVPEYARTWETLAKHLKKDNK